MAFGRDRTARLIGGFDHRALLNHAVPGSDGGQAGKRCVGDRHISLARGGAAATGAVQGGLAPLGHLSPTRETAALCLQGNVV